MPTRHCLICEELLVIDSQPLQGATVWRCAGEAESNPAESRGDRVFLEVLICDHCLVSKNDVIQEVVIERTSGVMERRSPGFC